LRSTNKQGIAYASAIVLVKSNNSPLSGATVTASYTGPTSGTVSGTTGTDGKVVLKTSTLKTTTGTWCFTVTNVVKTSYTYPGPNPTLCETKSALAQWEPSQASVNVFPNPFADRLYFNISSPEATHANIEIYEFSGRKVATVFSNQIEGGRNYTVNYVPENMHPGAYIYRVTMGIKTYNGKLIYNK
jgi:hypothetical protein